MKSVDHDIVLRDLMIRKGLATYCLKLLQSDPDVVDDPRQPAAVVEYQRQLNGINKKIDNRKVKLGIKPPPTVIGLKPGRLVGEVKQ